MKASALVAGGAFVALLLAGCGGDNSASVSNATSSGATSSVTSSTAKAPASSAGTTASSTGTTASSSGASSDNTTTPSFKGDANSDFCTFVKDIANSDLGQNLGQDPSKLKDQLQQVSDVMAKAQSRAPAEIKDDLATVTDAIKKYRDFLAQYDYDIAKLTAAAQKDPTILQNVTNSFSDAKFEQASNRVEAYGEQVCGITTDTTT